ncbi:hypothetical protein HD806DRAFT_485603 [Xylariaceae sp. AK1471]|nr:hypothetical protein HD806DRAFT_485603 [Xylariaceae sp. AK1471]
MNTNSTMNNAYFDISQDESEMAESPIIPKLPAQNYPRPQQPSYSSPGLRKLAIDRLKSRVPDAANPALVPVPLFSSAKCAVEAETIATMGDVAPSSSTGLAAATPSPTTTITMVTANPTPISPSPSLFPVPPSNEGILASPVSIVSPVSKEAPTSMLSPSSVYAQNSNGNTEAPIRPPRPASSIYSQNTVSTIVAASAPRTPTLTNWASILPGLPSPSPEPPLSGTQMSEDAYRQSHDALHNGQVIEEQPAPQQIQFQIQVPRLRSPSLPQDRSGRRRTISNTNSTHVNRKEKGSISSLPPAVRISEPAPAPVPYLGVNYEGGDWPLQKPSVAHNMPQKQYVHRSQGSDVSRHEPFIGHGANKDSISSSFTTTPGRPEPDVVSPRISLADSHTPIYGPNEQRSGWFSDDEDAEQGRDGSSGYAAVGMKEKQEPVQARRQQTKKIKIIAGVSILVALVVVGVAVGVVFGARRGG